MKGGYEFLYDLSWWLQAVVVAIISVGLLYFLRLFQKAFVFGQHKWIERSARRKKEWDKKIAAALESRNELAVIQAEMVLYSVGSVCLLIAATTYAIIILFMVGAGITPDWKQWFVAVFMIVSSRFLQLMGVRYLLLRDVRKQEIEKAQNEELISRGL